MERETEGHRVVAKPEWVSERDALSRYHLSE